VTVLCHHQSVRRERELLVSPATGKRFPALCGRGALSSVPVAYGAIPFTDSSEQNELCADAATPQTGQRAETAADSGFEYSLLGISG
jgi:hypothetical protein